MGYVLITGGSFVNKGAQAMTYVTVCEMKKRFPDKEILVAMDLNRIPTGIDLNNFNFKVISNSVIGREAMFWLGGHWRREAIKGGLNYRELLRVRKIWKNTDYVMDVSGYAIGKKWGPRCSIRTAMSATLAKKYNGHCIFLPQSFGPFDFKQEEKEMQETQIVLKEQLEAADVLYAREASGKKMLEELGLHNVKIAQDIVLQNKDYDVNLIYKEVPEFKIPQIRSKSVGLIPNKHVVSSQVNDVYALWDTAINKLTENGYTVYLMMHDNSDLDIIRNMKERHKKNANVILLDNDFSCIEYNDLVTKLDFMVASRYHSIVHAYRNAVPCVVLGWADKYCSLLETVNQTEYNLDLREKVSDDILIECLENMMANRAENISKLQDSVKKIQKNNVFEVIAGR